MRMSVSALPIRPGSRMLATMRRTILPPVLLCASAFAAGAAPFRAGDFGLPWRSTDGAGGLWRAGVRAEF